ncbi:hypothetical protein [Cryptosporangium japonicum]|uniref:Uncharacterized protein n=1 Tax=Cryptosporangium japonicum TaxID=80872 RepID=A0ABP3EGE6_9ACTN
MSQARHAIDVEPRYRSWILAAATSMAVVAVGVGGAVFTLGGGGESDVVAAANRFRPLAGWWQVEIEDRSGAGCLDSGCPMSVRRWQAERPPTPGELRRSIEAAGWERPGVDGDCRPTGNRTGAFPLCTAEASGEGMRLTLTVQQAESFDVTMTVESR